MSEPEILPTTNMGNSEDPSKSPTAWGEVIFGVAKDMDPAETLTTAIYMIWLCDPAIQQISINPKEELSAAVKEAITIAERKTPGTKLEIAIELIQSLILLSEDEEVEVGSDTFDLELEVYKEYRNRAYPDLNTNKPVDRTLDDLSDPKEILDWDYHLKDPLLKPATTIEVKIEYAGRSKPLSFLDSWDDRQNKQFQRGGAMIKIEQVFVLLFLMSPGFAAVGAAYFGREDLYNLVFLWAGTVMAIWWNVVNEK